MAVLMMGLAFTACSSDSDNILRWIRTTTLPTPQPTTTANSSLVRMPSATA